MRSEQPGTGEEHRQQVHAVVLERSGAVSALRNREPIDELQLAGVRGAEARRR